MSGTLPSPPTRAVDARARAAIVLASAVALAACSSDPAADGDAAADAARTDVDDAGADDAADDAAVSDAGDADAGPPSIAESLGMTRYSGAIPIPEPSGAADVTTYEFDPEHGPMCMRGAPFRVSVRETGSEDLVIFLQGGGACWTEFCLAVTGAPAGVPRIDILNPDLAENPVADWNVVYLPYCDGSFFAGDAEHDDDLNGRGTRYHRGLANLTAGLEVAAHRFPSARRIFLAGSSGGGYGLLLGAPLTRHYYPDAELIVMADSGAGLAREGEPAYIQKPIDEFGLQGFIPEDCDDCVTSGHLTGVVTWFLDRDPNVRVGLYSSWYDSVLARTFLQIPAARFAEGLANQTDRVHAAHPDRARRFITNDTQHTTLLGDPTGIIGTDITAVELPPGALSDLMGGDLKIGHIATTEIDGLTMAEWIAGLIDNDLEVWVDVLQERGPPPDGSGE